VITVIVQLKESSQAITYTNVINTYQKGSFYVLYTADEKSFKHPIETIWRIKEEYGYHGRDNRPPTPNLLKGIEEAMTYLQWASSPEVIKEKAIETAYNMLEKILEDAVKGFPE